MLHYGPSNDGGKLDSAAAVYRHLMESNTRLVTNIIFAGSPGHQISELDFFLRRLLTGDIPRDHTYLWAQREGNITEAMAEVFGAAMRQYRLLMVARNDLFKYASEVARMMPALGVDVGLSHCKISLASHEAAVIGMLGDESYYHVTNEAVLRNYKHYYRLREKTDHLDPWRSMCPPLTDELAALVGDVDKYAVLHFRTGTGNAGVPIKPETMFPSIEYLRDLGYTIVKVGTEAMPPEFARYDIVNYSESPLRSFHNDLALLAHAKLSLINASGLENLADVLDIPTVSYSRWHLCMVPYSRKTVVVPTLLYDPKRERLLTFAEQMLFFKTRQEFWEGKFFGWHFPIDRFLARAPQADEMLAAVQETVELSTYDPPLSAVQERVNRLDENGLLSAAKARVSNFFLERFETML